MLQENASLFCPIKINLHLEIGESYSEDGSVFHRVCTLLQGCFLQEANDLLELGISQKSVATADEVQIVLEVYPQAPCAMQENLVYRAARAYLKKMEQSFKEFYIAWPQRLYFSLQKHIPQGAGLGGGSSNAAAALKLLNQHLPVYCGCPALEYKILCELAANLGSDIPFFMRNFCNFTESLAWGVKRGEQIVDVSADLAMALQQFQSRYQLWLFKPQGLCCNTGTMYRLFDDLFNRSSGQSFGFSKLSRSPLRNYLDIENEWRKNNIPDSSEIKSWFSNDFYQVMVQCSAEAPQRKNQKFPQVRRLTDRSREELQSQIGWEGIQVLATLPQYLYTLGARWVGLCGSGAAFFAWFAQEQSKDIIHNSLALFPHRLEIFTARVCGTIDNL